MLVENLAAFRRVRDGCELVAGRSDDVIESAKNRHEVLFGRPRFASAAAVRHRLTAALDI
jgi:hypothetical protein